MLYKAEFMVYSLNSAGPLNFIISGYREIKLCPCLPRFPALSPCCICFQWRLHDADFRGLILVVLQAILLLKRKKKTLHSYKTQWCALFMCLVLRQLWESETCRVLLNEWGKDLSKSHDCISLGTPWGISGSTQWSIFHEWACKMQSAMGEALQSVIESRYPFSIIYEP